jgi:ElaB/YqjD/DUF883 family membrane-anchored ribosome-binding protein
MAKRKNHDLSKRIGALRHDLAALQKDWRGLVDEAGGIADRKIHDAIGSLMESLDDVTERVEEWGEDQLDTARDVVRKQPLVAVSVAFGVGAVIAAFLARR